MAFEPHMPSMAKRSSPNNVRHLTQPAHGPASILAIGTATPPHVFEQASYPDFYFNVTQSGLETELKAKFQRICDRSGIKKRHMYITEELLKANPSMCVFDGRSFDARQEIGFTTVATLGKEAAIQAIKEWDQPVSSITHLIFATTSVIGMPGPDYDLIKSLGLSPTVKRMTLFHQGCFAGGNALRIAKDMAENNIGSRVLVVCSEVSASFFRGPSPIHLESLIAAALFGDGASALVVGAGPIPDVERPCFEIHRAGSWILPGTEEALEGHLRESGMSFHLKKSLPEWRSANIGRVLGEALEGYGVGDWNEIFIAAHPGGRAVLDGVEEELGLRPEKLEASREVLYEYGNMSSPSAHFVLDRMRKKKSVERRCGSSGEGQEWGVMLCFGPGVTVECLVLKSCVHLPSM